MMPKMDGLNVLKKLWASHSEIPFILLSEKNQRRRIFSNQIPWHYGVCC